MTLHLPLIVDLDDTLLRTDTLIECVVHAAARNPLGLAAAAPSALEGRAAFKQRVAACGAIDVTTLVAREDLVDYLRAQKAAGREIHLVTAADQSIADAVAARFGIFDSATGSSGDHNLKGARKRAHLRQRFPGGYVYAGDSRADLNVWRDADGVILAGAAPSVARAARALGRPVEAEFARPPGGLRPWRRALRLHQWSKNLLVFAPLFLSGLYLDGDAIMAAIFAFVSLGLVASGAYVVNDLVDLAADRRHRTKCTRPFASGAIPVAQGVIAAPLLIVLGLGLAFAVRVPLGLAIAAYLCMTLSYSLGLKRIPLLDVLLLGGLFTIRLLIGVAAIGTMVSFWLLSFSMFFFFSLSLAKRHVEVAGAAPGTTVAGRGYRAEDSPLTLALGVSSGMTALVILCLYVINDASPVEIYGNSAWLFATPVIIAAWLLRVWLLANRGELDDDPVAFAVRDKVSILLGGALVASFAAAVYL